MRASTAFRSLQKHEVCDTTMQQRDSVSCQEYLDRAPESVLAIAAQRAPPDSTVSLKDWPDANVAVLQVGTIVH